MRLSIIIPAFDEEQAIGATVRACLGAREAIAANAGLDGVEVLVVDDGSRDRTGEIVAAIPAAKLVRHERNRGYGAALKTGFAHASGELLAFMDADGTLDPVLLGSMARTLLDARADVVSGNRLAPGNHMPAVRKLGNRLFAFLVNLVAPQHVTDLASGMRVLRRDALPRLEPLPDGMHYTPAMSAKALFDDSVQLVEIPVPYAERIGASKLSVLKDGQRFLRVLGEIALSYRPFAFFGTPGITALLIAGAYSVAPVREYAATGTLPDDAIYRVFTIMVLGVAGFSLVATGLVAEGATAIVHGRRGRPRVLHSFFDALFLAHPFVLGFGLLCAALFLDRHALATYLEEGRVLEPWIKVAVGGLLALTGVELLAFGALKKILLMLADRRVAREQALRGKEPTGDEEPAGARR